MEELQEQRHCRCGEVKPWLMYRLSALHEPARSGLRKPFHRPSTMIANCNSNAIFCSASAALGEIFAGVASAELLATTSEREVVVMRIELLQHQSGMFIIERHASTRLATLSLRRRTIHAALIRHAAEFCESLGAGALVEIRPPQTRTDRRAGNALASAPAPSAPGGDLRCGDSDGRRADQGEDRMGQALNTRFTQNSLGNQKSH